MVAVVQRLEPYACVQDGTTGLLFDDPRHLTTLLDQLAQSPALRQRLASAAHHYLHTQRRLEQHIPQRLDFYRQHKARVQALYTTPMELPEPLQRAAAVPLLSLPGWQELGPKHFRLDLCHPAEHHRAAGIRAMQADDFAQAEAQFAAAVRLDPGDATAHSLLGHCLLKGGRLPLARQALERACVLDPLLSRPVRALARLHSGLARHYAQRAAELNPLPAAAT